MARSVDYAYDVMFCFGFYSYHNKFYNTYQTSFRVSAFFYITIIKPTRSLSTVIRSSQLREASTFNPLTHSLEKEDTVSNQRKVYDR